MPLGTVEPAGAVPTARLIVPPVVFLMSTTGLVKPPLVATLFVILPLKSTLGSPLSTAKPALVMSVIVVFVKTMSPVALSSRTPVWPATFVPLIATLFTTDAPVADP